MPGRVPLPFDDQSIEGYIMQGAISLVDIIRTLQYHGIDPGRVLGNLEVGDRQHGSLRLGQAHAGLRKASPTGPFGNVHCR